MLSMFWSLPEGEVSHSPVNNPLPNRLLRGKCQVAALSTPAIDICTLRCPCTQQRHIWSLPGKLTPLCQLVSKTCQRVSLTWVILNVTIHWAGILLPAQKARSLPMQSAPSAKGRSSCQRPVNSSPGRTAHDISCRCQS